jgi:hypothetical protein
VNSATTLDMQDSLQPYRTSSTPADSATQDPPELWEFFSTNLATSENISGLEEFSEYTNLTISLRRFFRCTNLITPQQLLELREPPKYTNLTTPQLYEYINLTIP